MRAGTVAAYREAREGGDGPTLTGYDRLAGRLLRDKSRRDMVG